MPNSRNTWKTFTATLERGGDRLNWTVIRVPLDVPKIWGVRGQLRVKGEINGFAFRTSLFPDGKSGHVMIVNKKMQAGSKTALGAKAMFSMEPDIVPRKVTTPKELLRVLEESKRVKKYYESLSPSYRNYISGWVGEARYAETRERRAEQMVERLMLAMEAEQELPPMLRVVLDRNPKARAGWELMPRGHRRGHLLGIFGYRNPESRGRRVAKAVEEMLQYANKRDKSGRIEF